LRVSLLTVKRNKRPLPWLNLKLKPNLSQAVLHQEVMLVPQRNNNNHQLRWKEVKHLCNRQVRKTRDKTVKLTSVC